MSYSTKMKKAGALAAERATAWCVHTAKRDTINVVIVQAGSETEAYRAIEAPNGRRLKRPPLVLRIRPQLPTSEWQAIYREVGLIKS